MPLTAKLTVENGEQVIRLPKGIQIPGRNAEIRMEGGTLILHPQIDTWDDFFTDPPVVPDDFLLNRVDPLPGTKDPL